jgi:hypothetical protein
MMLGRWSAAHAGRIAPPTLAFLLAACALGATPVPPAGSIAHRTGAADVILRLEVGGGFVPIGWLVTQAPSLSLYGDGTVIARSPSAPQPSQLGSVVRSVPFRTGRLTEPQVHELLAFSLGAGGLRAARDHYDPGNVMDAPSTFFTIDAGDVSRTVSVVALGIVTWGQDRSAVDGLQRLASRLEGFASTGTLVGTYSPARYRAILTDGSAEGGAAGDPRSWPWPGLTPVDWTLPADKNRPSFPTRTMTPAEVAVLGIPSPEGGFQNLLLRAPDGRIHALAIRPLLPDEAA